MHFHPLADDCLLFTQIYRVSTKERNLSNVIPVQKHCVLSWTPGITLPKHKMDGTMRSPYNGLLREVTAIATDD